MTCATKRLSLTLAVALFVASVSSAQVVAKAVPFELSEVKLLPSPFLTANKICVSYLQRVDPDRLLHNFRENSGLKPKGDGYGGWEAQGLAGHTLGHYLTACSQEFASTKNKDLKAKIDKIVDELAECQQNRPDGLLSAMPNADKAWDDVRAGNIHATEFSLNGLWSPWYTHHKVLAGLIDAYHLTGNKKALAVASKFADWMIDVTRRLSDNLWQEMLKCEYGGMNEALANLSVYTKQPKYLDFAVKFYDRAILDPLSENKDSVSNEHSNTQIPKVIGLARLYELTNNLRNVRASKFFWFTMIKHHTYAIGGNSLGEFLGKPDQLSDRLSNTTCETCNTYNLLKLTRFMFKWDPRAEFFDYYERALYNHILSSQDPETGGMTYFMPLGSGSYREFSTPFDTFTCCHGSGLESHTKFQDSIFYHQGIQRLYVNLFIPSELSWRGQTVRLEANLPYENSVALTIAKGTAIPYELAIRHPRWATGTINIKVNGTVVATSNKPSSTILVKRTWKAGDKVSFSLPMSLQAVPMPDNPNRVAIQYGPTILAAKLAEKSQPRPQAPVIISDRESPEFWVQKDPKAVAFYTQGTAKPFDLTLRPFSEMGSSRYAVYFDRVSLPEWNQIEAARIKEQNRIQELRSRTIDAIEVGNKASEQAHNVVGSQLDTSQFDERTFTSILNEGFYDFDLKTDPTQPMKLVITYFGNERLKPGFTITTAGRTLVEEKLVGKPLNKFYDVEYNIPPDISEGALSMQFEILASPGRSGPSIAAIRIVRFPNN